MHDQQPAAGATAATRPQDGGEVGAGAHPMRGRQHERAAGSAGRLRPRASRGPCGDGWPGSNGRRGCAYAGGSRGSWTDGGCSAGRCACSRHYSVTWSGRGPVLLAGVWHSVAHRQESAIAGTGMMGTPQKVSHPRYGPVGGRVKPARPRPSGRLGTLHPSTCSAVHQDDTPSGSRKSDRTGCGAAGDIVSVGAPTPCQDLFTVCA